MEYLKQDELDLINDLLSKDKIVKIRRSKDGAIIFETREKIVKKIVFCNKNTAE